MKRTAWILCSNRWNSAITEYALRTAQALKLQGWQVELTALPNSHCERRAKEYEIQGPSSAFKLKDLPTLQSIRKRLKPDIILTFGGPETFLSRFLKTPVVRFRGQDSDVTEKLSGWDLRLSLGFCKGLLTPANVVQKRFQAILPNKPIAAILLGLDTKIFHYQPRSEQRPTLMIVGRLDPIKGHKSFFKLYSDLLKIWPNDKPQPYLQVIGQKSNISPEELYEAAVQLNLNESHYEIINERVSDLPKRMANATLGIIPSLGSEVIGRVTEEFLLCGTPVLVSRVGSLDECLITPDMGAILTLENLKLWLDKACSESDGQRQFRATTAKDHFSLEAMGQKLSRYLEEILGTK